MEERTEWAIRHEGIYGCGGTCWEQDVLWFPAENFGEVGSVYLDPERGEPRTVRYCSICGQLDGIVPVNAKEEEATQEAPDPVQCARFLELGFGGPDIGDHHIIAFNVSTDTLGDGCEQCGTGFSCPWYVALMGVGLPGAAGSGGG